MTEEIEGLMVRLRDARLMNPDYAARMDAIRVINRLQKNLYDRDKFIADKGLFKEFLESLPKRS